MSTHTAAASSNRYAQAAYEAMANRLRWHVLQATSKAGSGHPTSCFSAAELVSVLFFGMLRYDIDNPDFPTNDRFVLSKGHAAPLLWAVWAEAGGFPTAHLKSLRDHESDLEGHPTPRNEYVDVATGSLGQGLSNALGMAIASRFLASPSRIFCLMGDGELAEGSVWEAAALAGHRRVDNLVTLVDVNGLGQTGETMWKRHARHLARRFESFGWHAQSVDGHDVAAIETALHEAVGVEQCPAVILARTVKGKGVSFLEDALGRHGKTLEGDELDQAQREIGGLSALPEPMHLASPPEPAGLVLPERTTDRPDLEPDHDPQAQVATRQAYGTALAKLGDVDPSIVALDGEVSNSTHAEDFARRHASRYVECFIAEQNMVGMATGMSMLHWIPFVSTFAAFLTRAFDFLRMAAVSGANIKLCGSHAGVSVGEDGPSQMGLEDIAMMRALPGSKVLYPSDSVSTQRLVALAADEPGIVYLRTTRPKTPVLYDDTTSFRIGGSHTLTSSTQDQATIVAAGITVHEALRAHQELLRQGIPTRVIDLYSIKPLDLPALRQAARDTGLVVTVEDHYAEGGLGEAVAAALAGACEVVALAVRALPRSGEGNELLAAHGIDAAAITRCVRSCLGDRPCAGVPAQGH
jgi:transketolase